LEWSTTWDEDGGTLWYLVHWYDARAEVWRGVAPRQQTQTLLIPRHLFAEEKELRVRVLATPGIGTGIAESTIKRPDDASRTRPRLSLTGIDFSRGTPVQVPSVLHATLADSTGRHLPDDRMAWYCDGNPIGKGSQVDLRNSGLGKHYLRLVARSEFGPVATTWILERIQRGFQIHSEVCDPKPKRQEPPHKHPHPKPPNPCED